MAADTQEKCKTCETYLIEDEKELCETCAGEVVESESIMFFVAPKFKCTSCGELLSQSESRKSSDTCPSCGEESLIEF